MTDNPKHRARFYSDERSAESFWVRVPKTRVDFNIQLPPGRHYYRRAPLRLEELLEIAMSTPGSVVRVLEKTARIAHASQRAGDSGERRVVNKRMKLVDEVPENAVVLIYVPPGSTGDVMQ